MSRTLGARLINSPIYRDLEQKHDLAPPGPRAAAMTGPALPSPGITAVQQPRCTATAGAEWRRSCTDRSRVGDRRPGRCRIASCAEISRIRRAARRSRRRPCCAEAFASARREQMDRGGLDRASCSRLNLRRNGNPRWCIVKRRFTRFWTLAMAGYGFVVLLLATGMILAVWRFDAIARGHVGRIRSEENRITLAERLRWSGEAIVSTGRGYLISTDPAFLTQLD